ASIGQPIANEPLQKRILRDTPGKDEALDSLPTVDVYLSDITDIEDAVMLSVEDQQDGCKNGKCCVYPCV
ncbi:uncharacterized protein PADG_12199, partial [Paracoccidioides brasiliensis Pb18]